MFTSESTLETAEESGCRPPACCKFYSLNRWCRYGENCRFVHERYSTSWNNYEKKAVPRHTKYYRAGNSSKWSTKQIVVDNAREVPDAVGVGTESPSKTNDSATNLVTSNSATESSVLPAPTNTIPYCRFYANRRWCAYGNQCRFLHLRKPGGDTTWRNNNRNSNTAEVSLSPSEVPIAKASPDHGKEQRRSRRICVYFRNGTCKRNDNCHYLHPKAGSEMNTVSASNLNEDLSCTTDIKDQVSEAEVSAPQAKSSAVVTPKMPCLKKVLFLAELNEEELMKLRAVEISQMKKRFVQDSLIDHEDDICYTVTVNPMDPDWPYDVRDVKLKLKFPHTYPQECFEVVVQGEDNEALPETLLQHLTKSINNWLKERHQNNYDAGKVELMFRPFLKWFDRSMEELFTNGLRKVKRNVEAKAAGIEFVPYEHLPGSQNSDVQDNADAVENDEKQTSNTSEEQNCLDSSDIKFISVVETSGSGTNEDALSFHDGLLSETSNNARVTGVNMNDLKQHKKGTEMKLRNLQFAENVATVVCQKLHVTLQCSRCKNYNDIHTEPRRRNVFSCVKCHHSQEATFRPSILHQFTTVLGYLDLEGCQAFDLPLVDCIFAVECLNCNKQVSVDGIHYGKMWQSWCHYCNSKLGVYVDSTKFNLLQPNDSKDDGPAHILKLEKKDKKVKDPAIQEGKPLPNNGTCKHYKKSYRWFRFPCCGKAYPCDVCHDEKELEHEMKYATRIICGFCAKEQPFSVTKPCVMCASNMTKIEKSHWEGGKGCRDKVKMSKDDRQKYKGINKTVACKKVTDQKLKSKVKQKPEKV